MNGIGFLLIIVAFGFLWFVMIRPQKRRQVTQQQMLQNLRVGDRVLTAGGIYGEIRALRDDEIVVEIAPELEVHVARRAIAGVEPREDEETGEVEETEDPAAEAEEPAGADDREPAAAETPSAEDDG